MRLNLTIQCPDGLPFDHLPALKGAFHRWAGHNIDWHDQVSLYSYSWLWGSRVKNNRLQFAEGAKWVISGADPAMMRRVLAGIVHDPELHAHKMVVTDVDQVAVPDFVAGHRHFEVLSPVLVKANPSGGHPKHATHLLFSDPAATGILSASLQHKLRVAGLDDQGVTVAFDAASERARTKLFRYKESSLRASSCPVVITGSAEQLRFAWHVGVGHSTGIGCGAVN